MSTRIKPCLMIAHPSERRAPSATILIRMMVGVTIFSEGLQKVLYADELGAGRFAKIGLSAPELLAPFVSSVEMVCGALVLLGMFTQIAVVSLLGVITVAFITT
jgi:putative oxidoreductase